MFRIGYRQIKNLLKLLIGRPITTPSLASMTLDYDDVALAKSWLNKRYNWSDNKIVSQYEQEFAKWNDSKYAFAFMGGRVALSACIYALNLQPGDEVILPGYTCVVVPNAFHYVEVKTVYCDIELDTYGLDANKIESLITTNTRAILLQHLFGLVCRDYEDILYLAKKHSLKVIEDCAHSTGAEYRGQKVGNRGDLAFYSSERSKIFNTIQGGIAITNNDKLGKRLKEYYNKASLPDAERIEKLLLNIISDFRRYKHPLRLLFKGIYKFSYSDKILISTSREEEQGIRPTYYGCKMPTPVAAIGLNQLKKIDYYNERRREKAKYWDNWCEKKGYKKPVTIDKSISVYLRYPVLVEPEKKQNVSWAIKELEILPGLWFVSNIHPSKFIWGCSNANKAVKQCINLPSLF